MASVRRLTRTRSALFLALFALSLSLAGTAAADSIVAVPACYPGTGYFYNPAYLFNLAAPFGTLRSTATIPFDYLSDPSYSAFNSKGELFVANRFGNDNLNGSISRFQVYADGSYSVMASFRGNGLTNVHGVAFSPSGELFASNFTTKTLSRFKFDANGAPLPNGTVPLSFQPQGIAFDKKGAMYVADYSSVTSTATPKVRKFLFDRRGRAIEQPPIQLNSGISLHGLAFSSTGELFVADVMMHQVHRVAFDRRGNPVPGTSFNVPGGPLGVAFSPAGELFVTIHSAGTYGIFRYRLDSQGLPYPSGSYYVAGYLGGISIFDLPPAP